jgi:hypothetical protein
VTEAVRLLAELYGVQLAVYVGTGYGPAQWASGAKWVRVQTLLEREGAIQAARDEAARLLREERRTT